MNYQTALKQLTNKPFCKTPKWREQQGRAERQGAYVQDVYKKNGEYAGTSTPILDFEKAMVADCRKRGIPFFAHCVMRSEREQQKLFVTGKSKARKGHSPHQYGMAVDLIHGIHGWDLDRKSWEIIGHIGYEVANRIGVDIQWGGEWSFYDPAHWELSNWRELVPEEVA